MKKKLITIGLCNTGLKKKLMVMKLLLLLSVVFVIQTNASVYSQSTLLKVNIENKPIREVLSVLERSSEFKFFFNEDFIDVDLPVSINVTGKNIDVVLNKLLENTEIGYKVLDNNIIVLTKKQTAQQIEISGTVRDMSTNEPLPGVNIIIEGTTAGIISDIDGRYIITVPNQDAVLVFSFIGYLTEKVAIGNQTKIDIKLSPDIKKLEEVVVVGYGTMRKKDLTGSIIQVRPDNLANENPTTVQDVLRGTPGFQVGLDASAKGGGSMTIRGQRSVYTAGDHNAPLIVLDGMIFYGELSEINPDDIGQIDVLKDASAAAIYGSRAASGVIILTTKKGKLGQQVVNFNVNVGATTKSAYRDVFGPEEYMIYREDWYKKDTYGLNTATGKYEAYQTAAMVGKPGFYDSPNNLGRYGISMEQWRAYSTNTDGESDASIYARRLGLEGGVLKDYLAGNTFDWYDHTFRRGLNQDYNASVSGANDKMNYYMSVGYLRNEGAVKYNDYQSIRSNLKLEGKVNKWLEIGANVNFQNRSDGDL